MNWMSQLADQKIVVIKKYMAEMLKDKFLPHEQIIERLARSLVTEKDHADFSKLIAEVYNSAYLKAVDDHKEKLAKYGLKVAIVPQKP